MLIGSQHTVKLNTTKDDLIITHCTHALNFYIVTWSYDLSIKNRKLLTNNLSFFITDKCDARFTHVHLRTKIPVLQQLVWLFLTCLHSLPNFRSVCSVFSVSYRTTWVSQHGWQFYCYFLECINCFPLK